ncbi:hypothetical protein BAT02nite_18710 [Bacillus atrophaeus]|nr:hypothetical protein BAT02nite_18710 [Bacillus atrophaeus]
MQQIPVFETIMLTCGFLFLAYMGWVTWHSRPNPDETQKNVFSAKKQAAVSLLNPHAILDTAGVIGTNRFRTRDLINGYIRCLVLPFLGFGLSCWFWPCEYLKRWIRAED